MVDPQEVAIPTLLSRGMIHRQLDQRISRSVGAFITFSESSRKSNGHRTNGDRLWIG